MSKQIQFTPQQTLARFATLLGSIYLDDLQQVVLKSSDANIQNQGISKSSRKRSNLPLTYSSLSSRSTKVLRSILVENGSGSFPSLALTNYKHDNHVTSQAQIEANVAFYFAQEMLVVPERKGSQEKNCSSGNIHMDTKPQEKRVQFRDRRVHHSRRNSLQEQTEQMALKSLDGETNDEIHNSNKSDDVIYIGISDIPSLIVNNLVHSLSVLIDSRINTLETILLEHAKNVEKEHIGSNSQLQILEKICLVESIRKNMSISTAVTSFEICEESYKKQSNNTYKAPVIFTAVVDITFLKGRPPLSITMKASGSITGRFKSESNSLMEQVSVHLDTHSLASSMFQYARELSMHVFDCVSVYSKANTQNVSHESTSKEFNLQISMSHVRESPPKPSNPIKIKSLDASANPLPMVSPVISPSESPPIVPPGDLESMTVPYDSNQAAQIVDSILDYQDPSVMATSSKRQKVS